MHPRHRVRAGPVRRRRARGFPPPGAELPRARARKGLMRMPERTTPPQALRIDFRRGSPTPRWVAPLLLAVAVAFAGDVGFSFVKAKQNYLKNETALAKLDPRSYKPARSASPEEIALARET